MISGYICFATVHSISKYTLTAMGVTFLKIESTETRCPTPLFLALFGVREKGGGEERRKNYLFCRAQKNMSDRR